MEGAGEEPSPGHQALTGHGDALRILRGQGVGLVMWESTGGLCPRAFAQDRTPVSEINLPPARPP